MKEVIIKLIIQEDNGYGEPRESIEILVDNQSIGEGSYGGEPEDNNRYRTYVWVEKLIRELAKKLDAKVTIQKVMLDTKGEEIK